MTEQEYHQMELLQEMYRDRYATIGVPVFFLGLGLLVFALLFRHRSRGHRGVVAGFRLAGWSWLSVVGLATVLTRGGILFYPTVMFGPPALLATAALCWIAQGGSRLLESAMPPEPLGRRILGMGLAFLSVGVAALIFEGGLWWLEGSSLVEDFAIGTLFVVPFLLAIGSRWSRWMEEEPVAGKGWGWGIWMGLLSPWGLALFTSLLGPWGELDEMVIERWAVMTLWMTLPCVAVGAAGGKRLAKVFK